MLQRKLRALDHRAAARRWLKLKKDYIDGMGDTFDLVPIGGWRGDGRKKGWISPWLLACHDPVSGCFQSVCRVMSGFTDEFYKENTLKYRGFIGADEDGKVEPWSAESSDEKGAEGTEGRDTLVLPGRPDDVDTAENPRYWFRPSEVWEIGCADVTVSPVHAAGRGLVNPGLGMSLRFPRFIRKRPDKGIFETTSPEQIAAIFRSQPQRESTHGRDENITLDFGEDDADANAPDPDDTDVHEFRAGSCVEDHRRSREEEGEEENTAKGLEGGETARAAGRWKEGKASRYLKPDGGVHLGDGASKAKSCALDNSSEDNADRTEASDLTKGRMEGSTAVIQEKRHQEETLIVID